jgi:predicted Zn finger-like uncharacterized protein
MIIVCPTCSARFQYGDARFEGARSKRFKCPKCSVVFEVPNPHLPAPASDPTQAPAAAGTTSTAPRKAREALSPSLSPQQGALPSGMRFSLAFLTGPHASTVRLLDQASTVIGREEGEVLINDPEISRRHARLDIHPDGTVWLTDLESTNGTLLQGAPIAEPTQMTDRQEFTCGRSTFMVLIRAIDPMNPE